MLIRVDGVSKYAFITTYPMVMSIHKSYIHYDNSSLSCPNPCSCIDYSHQVRTEENGGMGDGVGVCRDLPIISLKVIYFSFRVVEFVCKRLSLLCFFFSNIFKYSLIKISNDF